MPNNQKVQLQARFWLSGALLAGAFGCGDATDNAGHDEPTVAQVPLVQQSEAQPETTGELRQLTFSVREEKNGNRVQTAESARWGFTKTTAVELASATNEGGAAAVVQVEAPKQRTLAELGSMSPNHELDVIVELAGPDLPRLPNADAARVQAVKDYEKTLAPIWAGIAAKATALGAKAFGHAWLNRSVVLRGPADKLRELVDQPEVISASFNHELTSFGDNDKCYVGLGGNNIGIDGWAWRVGSTQENLSTTYNGDSGGRTLGRVRVAILDSGIPARTHHAFRFLSTSTPGDRFLVAKVCSTSSCTTTTDPGSIFTHANPVTQWAVGNVEYGRDPNCFSSFDAGLRSGSRAWGAYILYYDVAAAGSVGMRLGLQDAVAQGADVANFSVGLDVPCDRSFDSGGLNSAIKNATDQGTLVVGAAGNKGWSGICSVPYPQMRPEVLTVGGLDTINRLANYNTTAIHPESSGGALSIHLANGSYGYDTVLDLLGPYVVNFTGTYPADWYANSVNTRFFGTSVASPAIAGTAARVLDGFRSIGWTQNARTLRLNMSMMGDAAIGPSTDMQQGTSYTSGYGRLHATVPAAGWAPAPSWWAQSPFTLQSGVTATGCVNGCQPMPSSVRQYNWVLFYEDADLTWAPHVGIQVKDLDTGQIIRQDTSTSLTKRIQLRDAEIWGRRLQLVVIPYAMAGNTTMYSGDFFHSDPAGWTNH